MQCASKVGFLCVSAKFVPYNPLDSLWMCAHLLSTASSPSDFYDPN
jgi:hypothetical protein